MDKHGGAGAMNQKIVSFLVSMALVLFAMAAGAACYHQYLVQRGMLRTSQLAYIPEEIEIRKGQTYEIKRSTAGNSRSSDPV